MTAATQARATVRRENLLINKPVSGSATIYAGTMFALLAADGMAVPAGTAASAKTHVALSLIRAPCPRCLARKSLGALACTNP